MSIPPRGAVIAQQLSPSSSMPCVYESAGHEDSQAHGSHCHRAGAREYMESLLVTILWALFGTTFILQSFTIPSQSMEPTLRVGDYLFVNKFIFGGNGAWYERLLPYRDIRHGDVVVFKFPFDDYPHFVKRVIGLPGDRVRILNQNVFVNGRKIDEPYVVHDPGAGDLYGDNFPPAERYFIQSGLRPEWAADLMSHVQNGELVVPPGNYFVMGDNRDHSWDSRYWGFVRREAVMGRPVVIYWSVEATSSDYADRGMKSRLTGLWENLIHLPSRTRWNRLMHEVH
jgi:signal peptidase I